MKEHTNQPDDLKKLRNRINWFCDNKVNAFSPTIAPAPKSAERNEIESIYEGIKYFADRDITELVIQKKYMGSYCDIYLHKELDHTYFVSRNGHLIQHIDLEAARQACAVLHRRFSWDGLDLVIVQAELMPWAVLGQGLIDNEFEGYLNAHRNHAQFLKTSGLYEKINSVKEGAQYLAFLQDKARLPAREIKEKYPLHILRQYTALEQFAVLDLDSYQSGIDIYGEQIRHFGKAETLHFKPFNILKKVYSNGQEEIVEDNCSYTLVNDEEQMVLQLNAGNREEQVQKVYEWFAALTGEQEEGIVIKPRKTFVKGLPPAFKVRNNHYLTMIYGVNFLQDLEYYISKRNTGRKLECSINDWAINRKLLAVPYADIHKENYYLKNLVLDRIMGEQAEATLDTRL